MRNAIAGCTKINENKCVSNDESDNVICEKHACKSPEVDPSISHWEFIFICICSQLVSVACSVQHSP